MSHAMATIFLFLIILVNLQFSTRKRGIVPPIFISVICSPTRALSLFVNRIHWKIKSTGRNNPETPQITWKRFRAENKTSFLNINLQTTKQSARRRSSLRSSYNLELWKEIHSTWLAFSSR